MKTSVRYLTVVCGILMTVQCRSFAEGRFQRDVRLMPTSVGVKIMCRATNAAEEPVIVYRLYVGANVFRFIDLKDIERQECWLREPDGELPETVIAPGGSMIWTMELGEVFDIYEERGFYALLSWNFQHVTSQYVCVGLVDETGGIEPPKLKAGSSAVETRVGFVHHPDSAPDICFLLLNGTNTTVTTTEPLVNDSRLVFTAPSINYSNELYVADVSATNVLIEAGNVAEWRMPWTNVYQRISSSDRALLKVAVDVDLVWKCGTYVSGPLPVNLGIE